VTRPLRSWAGVDVGAGKGFDAAVIDEDRVLAGPQRLTAIPAIVSWLREHRPCVVAVDSPRSAAPRGQRSRRDERELVRAGVCGIRYTPDAAALAANERYYAWIANGFELYAALLAAEREARWRVIECFPTATWSRLGGPRGTRSRARWSGEVLGGLGLAGVPGRINQDSRDAIGAAVTARLYGESRTQAFGEIMVPIPA
jgi:predicted nuclease with RNAse H fold